MSLRASVIICLLLFIWITASPVVGKCQNLSHLKVATAHVAPLVYQQNGQLTGTATTRVLQHFAKSSIPIDIVPASWARSLEDAKRGYVDALYPALASEQRSEFLDFSYIQVGKVNLALYSASNKPRIIEGAVVATLRGFEQSYSLLKGSQIVEVNSFAQAAEMIKLDRVDFIFGVSEIIEPYLQTNNIALHKTYMLSTLPVFFALAKNSPNYPKMETCLLSGLQ